MKKVASVLPILFLVVVLGACGSHAASKGSTNTNHPGHTSGGSKTSGGGGTTSGFCGDIDSAKTQLQNLRNLGSSPSLTSLTNDLKTLQTQITKASKSASALVKPDFQAVNTADTGLQTVITQLKGSGAPVSTYLSTIKKSVATIATAFDAVVSASKCV